MRARAAPITVRLKAHLLQRLWVSNMLEQEQDVDRRRAHRRPMMSTASPQKRAPTVMPALNKTLKLPISLFGTSNSCAREEKPCKRYCSFPLVAHEDTGAHLLDLTRNKTEDLRPAEIEEIAEPAQEEDAPLRGGRYKGQLGGARSNSLPLPRNVIPLQGHDTYLVPTETASRSGIL